LQAAGASPHPTTKPIPNLNIVIAGLTRNPLIEATLPKLGGASGRRLQSKF